MKAKKTWEEFKKFAFKGNVVDMAVGVIIGGAFGKIVTSLVNDIVMPLIGALIGGMDFKEFKWVISQQVVDAAGNVVKPEAAVLYGSFIQNVVDFFLIALSIFLFIKIISKLKRKKEEAPAEPKKPTTEELLTEIVALMKGETDGDEKKDDEKSEKTE